MKTIFSGLTVIIFMLIATSAYSGLLVSEYQSSECDIQNDAGRSVYVCDNGDRRKSYDYVDCSRIPNAQSEAGYLIVCKEFKMGNQGYDFPGASCDNSIICLNGEPKPIYNPSFGTWECKCPKMSL